MPEPASPATWQAYATSTIVMYKHPLISISGRISDHAAIIVKCRIITRDANILQTQASNWISGKLYPFMTN